MMACRGTAGLNVTRADRDIDGLSIPCGTAPTFYDRVKAIFPEAIVFLPLSFNEPEVPALIEYSLTSRVLFNSGMILGGPGSLSLLADTAGRRVHRRLRRNLRPYHHR
jgi:hypothetical protein